MTPDEFVKTLDGWTRTGGKLPSFQHHYLTTAHEAEAVVRALERGDLDFADEGYPSPNLFGVAALVQSTYAPDVDAIFRVKALPPLRVAIARALDSDFAVPTGVAPKKATWAKQKRADACLFALRVVAYYGEARDNALIIRAAKRGDLADNEMWSTLLDYVQEHNPAAVEIAEALRTPLPTEFLRIAYLDFANALAIDDRLARHPFDTPEGLSFLLKKIRDTEDEGYDSHAVSAIAAAPFLSDANRKQILAAALKHPRVRDEAAWAKARAGAADGEAFLMKACADPRLATRAIKYLTAIGKADRVPPETATLAFAALRRVSDWLSNEQDLGGQPPDEIAMVESRTVRWPPDGQARTVFIVGFRHHGWGDEIDGLVTLAGDTINRQYAIDTPIVEALACALRADTSVGKAYPNAAFDDDAFWQRLFLEFNPRGK